MNHLSAPSIVTRTAEGKESFPFLSHRTVAELPCECSTQAGLFTTPDRVSTVPIIEGPWPDDCWEFRFIIPGGPQ